MTALIILAIGAAVAGLIAWLRGMRAGPPVGKPTDASVQVAINAAGLVEAQKAQTKAVEVKSESDAAVAARVAELRERGRAGK